MSSLYNRNLGNFTLTQQIMTATSQENTESVHIYDHPESRIAFLETTLAGEHWRATVYPSAVAGQDVGEIVQSLRTKGYIVENSHDKYGNSTLEVTHLPDAAGLRDNIRSLGLVKGTEHTLSQMNTDKLFGTVKDGARYVVGDKAHIVSAFYLMGDMLLMLAGAGNQTSGAVKQQGFAAKLAEFKKPENVLQSLSGVGTMMTSLILMVYAQEGNSSQYKQMKEQLYKAMIHGKDPTDMANWAPPEKPHTMLGRLNETMHNNGLEGAVAAQCSAMAMQIASGGLRWKSEAATLGHIGTDAAVAKKLINSSKLDILRGFVSIAGWMSLLYPAHEVKEKAPWYNPMRAVQSYQEHPERFASVLTASSSVIAMRSGQERKNPFQVSAEASLLLGDAVLFFTDTKEYGVSPQTPEALGKMAAKFISESPLLLDTQQQADFVQRLSHYLSGNMAARHKDWIPDERTPELASIISSELEKLPNRLNDVANEAAKLISELPASQRSSATQALCQTLCDMPGTYLDAGALKEIVHERIKEIPALPGTPQTMQSLAPQFASLVAHLPMAAVPQNAMRLYDVTSQFCASTPRDAIYLSHAMKKSVEQHAGLSTADIQQLERKAGAQQRSTH